MKKDTGANPEGMRSEIVVFFKFHIRHIVGGLCDGAKDTCDNRPVKEICGRVVLILVYSQGNILVLNTDEAVESTKDVVETANSAAIGVSTVGNDTSLFAMGTVFLPGESKVDLGSRMAIRQKRSDSNRSTPFIEALNVLKSESQAAMERGNWRRLASGGEFFEFIFLGPLADAASKVGVRIRPIFHSTKEAISVRVLGDVELNQCGMHRRRVRVRFVRHLLVSETFVPNCMEGLRHLFVSDRIESRVAVGHSPQHTSGCVGIVLHRRHFNGFPFDRMTHGEIDVECSKNVCPCTVRYRTKKHILFWPFHIRQKAEEVDPAGLKCPKLSGRFGNA